MSFAEGDAVIVQGSWVDLSGEVIEDVLSDSVYPGVTGLGGALLTDGAKGVRFSMRGASDVYSLSYDDPGERSCTGDLAATGNCNAFYRDGAPITSLDALFLPEGEVGRFIEVGDARTIYS